jgi:hypothetical protein
MPSVEHFIDVGDSKSADWLFARNWSSFADRNELQAILVVRYDLKNKTAEVQWAHNLPLEAFNGSENQHLVKALEECFLVHPKPHVHAMKHDGLADVICRLNRSLKEQYRMWFFPLRCGAYNFVILAFPAPDKGKGLPSDLKDQLSEVFVTLDGCLRAYELHSRIEVTEKFLKEVGHDIASAVQASVAKLRNISEGRVMGDGVRVKSKEIEQEIWNIFRIAESLGIVADPDYKLRMPEDFDLNVAVKTIIKHFNSEANERNLRLKINSPKDSIFIWGEKLGIQQAIGQLIFNAIKYSFGGTDIFISTAEREDDILIRVTNKGHPLPDGPELKQIWDFGYRGKIARELHVNGSGIGLYTVKKVITAHLGWTDAQSANGITEFFIHLPKKAALKRDLGILI